MRKLPHSDAVSPSLTDDFGGSVYEEGGGGLDNLASLEGRLSRYASAKSKAEEIMDYGRSMVNRSAEDPKKARAVGRLGECAHYMAFRHYLDFDKVRLVSASFCEQKLLCPVCAIRRAAKCVSSYSKVLQALDQVQGQEPYVDQLLTLTVKNGDDLNEREKHLRESISKMNQRRRNSMRGRSRSQFGLIDAAVGAFEVTNIGNGWHPHAHIWVRAPRLLHEGAVSAEWLDITGDSHVVNVTPIVGDRIKAFCEVFKYAVKFSDLTPDQIWQVWEVCRGRRMIFSYGAFRGVEVPETLLDEEMTGPYVEYFYRWLGSSYGLKMTTEVT